VGAAALAMGGAGSAVPGALSPWWNPALTGSQKERKAALGFGFRSLGQTDGFASIEFRVPPRVGMGVLFLYRGDPFLNNLYDDNENPLEPAAYTSLTGKIAISYHVLRNLSAGLNVSILYEQLPSGYVNGKVNYSSAYKVGAFDFALSYRLSDRLHVCALLKDAGASMDWNFGSDYGYYVPNDDRMLPVFLLGSSYCGTMRGRPLIWNADLRGYFFTGEWKKIDRPQAVLSSGVEWQYWKTVFLRMGMGELPLNGDIFGDTRRYRSDFSFRLTGGIAVDMSAVRRGLRLDYGVATDKVWAGIDQQLDITYTF
ncbi:MAG: hypothetical protein JW913_05320, partial [Chitinispirillaceae bacterium]|nr:hypothetical protein [Chitinispirillaceae bacterium]